MSGGLQVLLFPAMKPEDQKAGALTSAAPPSAVQHPGPSSTLVTCFPSHMPKVALVKHLQQASLVTGTSAWAHDRARSQEGHISP